MKKIISYGVSIIIAVALIMLIEPYLEKQEENKKYDFTVETIDGKVSKKDFKGKVLAIYFGYTYCPDVCPTSLATLSHALSSFSEEKTKEFAGLFISVDPKRDKLKELKEYSKYFHKNFLGATSNKENIDDIVQRYGSFYKVEKLKDSVMDYSVAHTSYIYIFDKDGSFVKKVDHFTNPEQLKEVLAGVL